MLRLKRYLLIALMLVLLPLRGWAGNVMAVDMAAQQVAMAQVHPTDVAAMSADCAMAMQTPAEAKQQVSQSSSHCHSCDTCQLCLALATTHQAYWVISPISRHSAVLHTGTEFSSADSASSFKPPIF